MSAKMGRPTKDPKTISKHIRFSDKECEMLDYCCKETGMTQTEIIKQGIKEVYEKIKK